MAEIAGGLLLLSLGLGGFVAYRKIVSAPGPSPIGYVLDEHLLPMAHAPIEVRSGGRSFRLVTDAQGSFYAEPGLTRVPTVVGYAPIPERTGPGVSPPAPRYEPVGDVVFQIVNRSGKEIDTPVQATIFRLGASCLAGGTLHGTLRMRGVGLGDLDSRWRFHPNDRRIRVTGIRRTESGGTVTYELTAENAGSPASEARDWMWVNHRLAAVSQ